MMSEGQGSAFQVEQRPRFAGDVTLGSVFASWIERAQSSKLIRPRLPEAHVMVRVPLVELQALLGLIEENTFTAEELLGGPFDTAKEPQPAPRKPRKAKAPRKPKDAAAA